MHCAEGHDLTFRTQTAAQLSRSPQLEVLGIKPVTFHLI